MEKKQVIDAIIDREWEMFRVVNGEERVSCQNDRDGFRAMRGAQYDVWSQPACESYLADLTEAERQGRNLPREKYIRMMKDTEPAAYAVLSRDLPAVSEEKQALVDGIWEILLRQTERLREEYPLLALGGRPLHARDEGPGETSVETYQRGELLTYSERTLRLLLDHAFRDCGVTRLHNDFEPARKAAWKLHRDAGFCGGVDKDGLLQLMLTREEYLARHP